MIRLSYGVDMNPEIDEDDIAGHRLRKVDKPPSVWKALIPIVGYGWIVVALAVGYFYNGKQVADAINSAIR